MGVGRAVAEYHVWLGSAFPFVPRKFKVSEMVRPIASWIRAGGLVPLALFSLLVLSAAAGRAAEDASFARFDRRAKAGDRLNVVFFGCSLTWGANATDPQLTSFRAQFADRLTAKYPAAHFRFWDAAIGGTGSQLGVFRLDRDVLRHKPDLVLVDFSANDDIYSDNLETMASYEAIIRRILLEAQAPVVQVIFPFEWNVAAGKLDGMKRREMHRALAAAYRVPSGDAIELAQQRVAAGETTIKTLWPTDGVHPGDEGYKLFTDAAWTAFEQAVAKEAVCQPPEKMLYAHTYLHSARTRLSSLGTPPAGWQIGAPNLVAAYFDMLMSRWLDDETIARAATPAEPDAAGANAQPAAVRQPARFKAKFRGQMLMFYGETTRQSGKYRVYIDGMLITHRENKDQSPLEEFDAGKFGRTVGGNAHLTQIIAEGLDPEKEHLLEIEPAFEQPDQELRLESICVAGPHVGVWRAE